MIKQYAFEAVLDLHVLLCEAEVLNEKLAAIARATFASLKSFCLTTNVNITYLTILRDKLGRTATLEQCVSMLAEKLAKPKVDFGPSVEQQFTECLLDFITLLSCTAVRMCMHQPEESYVMACRVQALSNPRTSVTEGNVVDEQGSLQMWLGLEVVNEIGKRYPSLNLPK